MPQSLVRCHVIEVAYPPDWDGHLTDSDEHQDMIVAVNQISRASARAVLEAESLGCVVRVYGVLSDD